MAAVAEAVRTWEPVPTDADNRVWEPVPTSKERVWEPVPGLLTPREQQADEETNRTPANQEEIKRGIREAPTPEARQLIQEEQARIAAQPTSQPVACPT